VGPGSLGTVVLVADYSLSASPLYQSVPSHAVVRTRPRIALAELWLTRPERDVAERINDRWDVATLVLTCPIRELPPSAARYETAARTSAYGRALAR
jgi:hypothetical protein